MSTLIATAERTIAAPAEDLFSYVADFREHHPHFLPPAFHDFTVEAGGVGLGTVTSSSFSMGGRTQRLRTRVTRVEDARIIEEEVVDRPMRTTFHFEPATDPGATTVGIETTWQPEGGLGGMLERLFAPRMLSRVYAEELARLEAYAASRS